MSVIQQFRQQARFGERMGEASRSHYMARMQTLRLDGFLLRPLLSLFSGAGALRAADALRAELKRYD